MGVVEKRAIRVVADLRGNLLSITGVPTTITVYAHGLDRRPSAVFITHTAYGTTGVVREVVASRNTSAISLQGSISGIGVDVTVVP